MVRKRSHPFSFQTMKTNEKVIGLWWKSCPQMIRILYTNNTNEDHFIDISYETIVSHMLQDLDVPDPWSNSTKPMVNINNKHDHNILLTVFFFLF